MFPSGAWCSKPSLSDMFHVFYHFFFVRIHHSTQFVAYTIVGSMAYSLQGFFPVLGNNVSCKLEPKSKWPVNTSMSHLGKPVPLPCQQLFGFSLHGEPKGSVECFRSALYLHQHDLHPIPQSKWLIHFI